MNGYDFRIEENF